MDGEYRSLTEKSLESSILFIGEDTCPPNYFFRGNNVRNNYVIHYIQDGKGTFSAANQPAVTLKKGDVFLLPKGVPCFYQADGSDPWKYFWIGLSGTKIKSMLAGSDLLTHRYLRQVQHSRFFDQLSQLYAALKRPESLANDILVEALTYQMFYQLVTEYPNKMPHESKRSQDQVHQAIRYLQEHYHQQDCNVAVLSRQLGLSRSYLYTIFKKRLNLSPQRYLMRLRMEEARQLLQETSEPVNKIARRVGYRDEFTFSKAFKRFAGTNPTSYRQAN